MSTIVENDLKYCGLGERSAAFQRKWVRDSHDLLCLRSTVIRVIPLDTCEVANPNANYQLDDWPSWLARRPFGTWPRISSDRFRNWSATWAKRRAASHLHSARSTFRVQLKSTREMSIHEQRNSESSAPRVLLQRNPHPRSCVVRVCSRLSITRWWCRWPRETRKPLARRAMLASVRTPL